MHIHLNGEKFDFTNALGNSEDLTIERLLELRGQSNKRIAVEVNQNIIPKSQHGQYRLSDNDRVEIVHAIGGG